MTRNKNKEILIILHTNNNQEPNFLRSTGNQKINYSYDNSFSWLSPQPSLSLSLLFSKYPKGRLYAILLYLCPSVRLSVSLSLFTLTHEGVGVEGWNLAEY